MWCFCRLALITAILILLCSTQAYAEPVSGFSAYYVIHDVSANVTWDIESSTTTRKYLPVHVSTNTTLNLALYQNGVAIGSVSDVTTASWLVTLTLNQNIINVIASDPWGGFTSIQATINSIPQVVTFSNPLIGDTQIIIQPGAASEDLIITMNLVTNNATPAPSNTNLASDIIDFVVQNIAASDGFVTLNAPAQITIPYFGTTSKVAVFFLDERQHPPIWTSNGIQIISVNLVAHSITFTVSHFTKFGVMTIQDTSPPLVEWVKANGTAFVSGNTLPENPVIQFTISDKQFGDDGLGAWQLSLREERTALLLGLITGNLQNIAVSQSAMVTFDLSAMNLAAGKSYAIDYQFIDRTTSPNSVTGSITHVKVMGALDVNRFVVAPNPVNIDKTPIHFTYELTADSNVLIKVFSISGELLYQTTYSAGTPGATYGANDVPWNGRDIYNEKLSNSVYFVFLIAEQNGIRIIKKFKLAVLR